MKGWVSASFISIDQTRVTICTWGIARFDTRRTLSAPLNVNTIFSVKKKADWVSVGASLQKQKQKKK
jgi:hypothetical protein